MSPEKPHSRIRYSDGWRKHLRREKAAQNKLRTFVTPEERQRKLTTASWTAVKGLLNLETYNNPLVRPIFEDIYEDEPTGNIIRRWYDAAYKDTTSGDGQGTRNRDEFTKQHTQDETSENYDPLLVIKVKPLLKMVDAFLFKPVLKKK